MCGRYTLKLVDRIVDHFEIVEVPVPLFARYNIAPTQEIPTVPDTSDGSHRELAMCRWGLVPSWASDPSIGNRMINARGETAAEKPAFRKALAQRRCLIPADGFYEWKRQQQGTGGGKQPYYIQLKSGDLFAFAGLWERWKEPDGSPLDTCTVLTTSPNELMADLHNRMPVIVAREDYGRWLSRTTPLATVQSLLNPYPTAEMEAWPVSTRVNSPANEDRACIDRADLPPATATEPSKPKKLRPKNISGQGELFGSS